MLWHDVQNASVDVCLLNSTEPTVAAAPTKAAASNIKTKRQEIFRKAISLPKICMTPTRLGFVDGLFNAHEVSQVLFDSR
jgi:hypothetical protein